MAKRKGVKNRNDVSDPAFELEQKEISSLTMHRLHGGKAKFGPYRLLIGRIDPRAAS